MESNRSLQFVVLHHTGVESPHFDLFFESAPGSELSAIRLDEWPPTAKSIFAFGSTHRRLYLSYEGAISGDRGEVSRVATGACEIEQLDGKTTLRFEDHSLPAIRWPATGRGPIALTS